MEHNQTAQDIQQGLNVMANGKEAGRERTAELVAKNGYVAFKNLDAVAQFHADPHYVNWICKYVDGEYQFYPPQKEQILTATTEIQQDEKVELYDATQMPLSNDPRLRQVQEKIINGEELTTGDKLLAGRDHPVKTLYGYDFKPNYAYRAISNEAYEAYKKAGYVVGFGDNDEFIAGQNNLGVDWYLGGVDPKYGKGEVILECPADKRYFTPTLDNGSGMALDPSIRHMKSSGSKNPIPMTMIKIVNKPILEQEAVAQIQDKQSSILQEPQILETYKETIKDLSKTTFISVGAIQEDPSKCKYELTSIDKTTGERKKIQETIVNFDGKFSMETLPSLYNQLAGGVPTIDFEKEKIITMQNMNGDRIIEFGNLNSAQIQLIMDMKSFIDSQYAKNVQENSGFYR